MNIFESIDWFWCHKWSNFGWSFKSSQIFLYVNMHIENFETSKFDSFSKFYEYWKKSRINNEISSELKYPLNKILL